jgi:hypothetical protein
MYIWRIKPLRQQLASDGLSQKQAFQYYLWTTLLGCLLYEMAGFGAGAEFSATVVLDASMYFGFNIAGIIWCYRQNGGAEGSEFLARIVPVGWVMFWRLASIVIPFFILLGVIDYVRTGSLGRPGSDMALLIILMNALYGGMWWRMGVHMKWIAEHRGN